MRLAAGGRLSTRAIRTPPTKLAPAFRLGPYLLGGGPTGRPKSARRTYLHPRTFVFRAHRHPSSILVHQSAERLTRTAMAILWKFVEQSPHAPKRKQSRAWRKVAAAHLRSEPFCAACGSRRDVRPHHVIPVSVDPSLELDLKNLVSLCESYSAGVNCHLFFGHGGQWSTYNPNVRADAWNYRAARHLRVLAGCTN